MVLVQESDTYKSLVRTSRLQSNNILQQARYLEKHHIFHYGLFTELSTCSGAYRGQERGGWPAGENSQFTDVWACSYLGDFRCQYLPLHELFQEGCLQVIDSETELGYYMWGLRKEQLPDSS